MMKRTIQYLLTGGGVVLLSGFLVNAMSVKKEENKTTKKSTSEKAIKVVKITMKNKAYVYDKNGKRVKNYLNTKYIGKGVTVKGLGTKTIKGVKYYALQPNHYYVKASDVTVK